MGLYTFLYENLLYRLYFIRIQPARIVTARLSRYTAHTAYTAIQPYTPYIIQRYTASLCTSLQAAPRSCVCFLGASRRILCRAREMKTCMVRCSSASGGDPGDAVAVAPDMLASAPAVRSTASWWKRAICRGLLLS